MVKPAFSYLDVELFHHTGRLGASQPFLCLFHNSKERGSPILVAAKELKAENGSAHRTLTFERCPRGRSITNLRLEVVSRHDDMQVMNIRCEAETATIVMTKVGLDSFIDACTKWLEGAEDFCVSPRTSTLNSRQFGRLDRESGELWFWGPGYTGP